MNANEQRPMIKRFGQHKRCVRARLLTQSSQLTATSGTLRGLRVVTAAVGPSVAGSGGKKKKKAIQTIIEPGNLLSHFLSDEHSDWLPSTGCRVIYLRF